MGGGGGGERRIREVPSCSRARGANAKCASRMGKYCCYKELTDVTSKRREGSTKQEANERLPTALVERAHGSGVALKYTDNKGTNEDNKDTKVLVLGEKESLGPTLDLERGRGGGVVRGSWEKGLE